MSFLYGPLYSRRLGISLGIDIIPYKTCSFNCIYCHEGETTHLTVERENFFLPEEILTALKRIAGQKVIKGRLVDYLTFAGSGEPTLNKSLGSYISYLKAHSPLPVAVITNSSLLWRDDVRSELFNADLVVPSLDAASEPIFSQVNRPHPELSFNLILEGLQQFCREFTKEIWLEALFCRGFNDGKEELEKIRGIIHRLPCHRIQLNTVTRPPAHALARPALEDTLTGMARKLGKRAVVVEDAASAARDSLEKELRRQILQALGHAPHTHIHLASALDKSSQEIIKVLSRLEKEGRVERYTSKGSYYYRRINSI